MPEGDTIFRTAQTLHCALAGQRVTRFESVYPALTRVDHDRPLKGRLVESVVSRGKHVLMELSGDLILHTHMRMHGSWHVYRPGERWQRPGRDMRVLVETKPYVAVAFNVPVAELLTSAGLARHESLSALGPDLTDPAFDAADVVKRMRAHDSEPIQDVVLNQRVLSGIGNVFKSEVLFVAGVDPFARTGDLSDAQLARTIEVARRQMAMNIGSRIGGMPAGGGRRTTGSLDATAKLWVYGRGGRACRRCGTPIASKVTGVDGRLTYWCPQCQPATTP